VTDFTALRTTSASSTGTLVGLVEAMIATTPVASEEVDVLIGGIQRTGPCRWTPLVIDGALFTPARDDPCVVQQARDGHQVVVWWEPGDGRAGVPFATSPVDLDSLAAAVVQRMWSTGDVRHTLRSTAATGWLIAQGQAVTSTYPDLRALLIAQSSPWGVSGADPLLPDLRGRTLIGAGTGAGLTLRALGDLVGTETHLLTTAQIPSHAHQQIMGWGAGANGRPIWDGSSRADYGDGDTNNTGGGASHPNMQPSAVVSIEVKT
jgi:microcystin-dependent protein